MTEQSVYLPTIAIPANVCAFVNGQKRRGHGIGIPVIYPATGAPVSMLTEDTIADVDAAVGAARTAFDKGPWPHMPTEKRQVILTSIAQTLRDNADELARLECLNTGIVFKELQSRHVWRAAYNFEFFAHYLGHASGLIYDQTAGYRSSVVRVPAGVAALIAPWNAPLALASMKVAAAIAFGNTCVLKPSEQTPLALARFVELLGAAGLPEGVVNLVNGRGSVTGAALVSHPDIDRVSFTGGTETGREIMAAAGRNLVPCTMELGGKSANIIFESADLDRALDGALVGIFSNNGQQCLAGSRILVQKSIADRFIAQFVERARKIVVGDPMEPRTEIGPIASEQHRDRILLYADIARQEGATLLTGGKKIDDPQGGFYLEPTAVLAPSNRIRVAQEEIFGPFAAFIVFDTIDEAIAIANDTRYGLVSYVWSDHLPTVTAASNALRAGTIWVNTPMTRELRAPFGGFKESGVGREGGASCEHFYTEEKTITIPTGTVPIRKLGVQ